MERVDTDSGSGSAVSQAVITSETRWKDDCSSLNKCCCLSWMTLKSAIRCPLSSQNEDFSLISNLSSSCLFKWLEQYTLSAMVSSSTPSVIQLCKQGTNTACTLQTLHPKKSFICSFRLWKNGLNQKLGKIFVQNNSKSKARKWWIVPSRWGVNCASKWRSSCLVVLLMSECGMVRHLQWRERCTGLSWCRELNFKTKLPFQQSMFQP